MATTGHESEVVRVSGLKAALQKFKTDKVTKSGVGLGNVGNFKAVSTAASQGLSSTEQSNARANIGAGTSSLALGETSSTAYRGDRGKTAYDHSQATHARTDATKTEASSTNGNIKINGTETTVYTHPAYTAATAAAKKVGLDATGHVVLGDALAKSDVGLGSVVNTGDSATPVSGGTTKFTTGGAYTELAKKIGKTVEITWANLKSARDNSTLVPGQWYRITDYVTKTDQEYTSSANHQFDVIVRADAVNKLNENAYAAIHSGDTYFANSKLEAWELKYCIDNDTNRFAWAYSAIGKGVIYWMKDEFGNECPYDFKNIRFVRSSSISQSGIVAGVYYYTFSVVSGTSDDTVNDYSLSGTYCYDNKISDYFEGGKRYLNDIIFRNLESSSEKCYGNNFGCSCRENTFGNNCYGNSLNSNCYGNNFGSGCYGNSLNSNCYGNNFGNTNTYITFGNECRENTFGSSCARVVFGDYCYSNNFSSYCYDNTFGSYCYSNTFSTYCAYNKFENHCYSNTFNTNCNYNTFGTYCYSNTFGSYCQFNSFGTYCYSNSFGNYCKSNTFGNYCYSNKFGTYGQYNTFGTYCYYIKFGTSSTLKNYYRNIIIENSNYYIYLNCSATTSSSLYLQKIKIAVGTCNSASYKTITHPTSGDGYMTVYQPADSRTKSV